MVIVNEIIASNLNVMVEYISQKELGSMHKDFSSFDISEVSVSLFYFFILTHLLLILKV